MMLVSIEPERPGVDLHRLQYAVCNHVLTALAAYEDPLHSKAVADGFKVICTHRGDTAIEVVEAKRATDKRQRYSC